MYQWLYVLSKTLTDFMKTLCNTDTELKEKTLLIKKACIKKASKISIKVAPDIFSSLCLLSDIFTKKIIYHMFLVTES